MKAIMRTTVKYGSGKYLHVGETYDLDGALPADVKKALTSIKDNPALVRLVGVSSEPPVTEEPPSEESVETSKEEPADETAPLSRRA